MGKFIQESDSHGSLKDIQVLINERKELFDKKISGAMKDSGSKQLYEKVSRLGEEK